MTLTRDKLTKKYDLKRKYLKYFRALPVQKLAAASIGKDEDTIIRWKKEDTDFADQVGVAKAEWALEKCGQVKSTEWLLERVLHDHFPHKIEVEERKTVDLRELLDRWQVSD